jgi:hypothetical protein
LLRQRGAADHVEEADLDGMENHYAVLGVPRSASASAIRTAYRKLARLHHPDVNENSPDAALRMAEINRAYKVLSDPSLRAAYDRKLILLDSGALLPVEPAPRPVVQNRVAATLRERRGALIAVGAVALGITCIFAWVVISEEQAYVGSSDEEEEAAADVREPSAQLEPRDAIADASARAACMQQTPRCPAGTSQHLTVAQGMCQQWCSDADGMVVARSTTSLPRPERAADAAPPASKSREHTELFWDRRLSCTYHTGQPPRCSLSGAEIALGELTEITESRWRVRRARGAAPASTGAHCRMLIEPVTPEPPAGSIPPYNCRIALSCGRAVYGEDSTGLCLCDVVDGRLRGAVDFATTSLQGDPALALDVAKRRLQLTGARWQLQLAPER